MLSIVVGIVVGLGTATIGLIFGIAAGSVTAGFIAYSVSLSISGLIFLPYFVAVVTHIYRQRAMAEARPGATSG